MLIMDQNAGPTTILIGRAAYAPFNNTTSSVDEERHDIEGDGSCNENKHQAQDRKIAESERYETHGRYAHPRLEAIEKIKTQPLKSNTQIERRTKAPKVRNIVGHSLLESKGPVVDGEYVQLLISEQIETQRQNSGRRAIDKRNVNEENQTETEYAVAVKQFF